MSEQNFKQSMKPFCGGSEAAGTFIEANYPLSKYDATANTDKQPELMFGTSLENHMLAKNYNASARQAGMGDNDIHNQYVDFIVRTALYHREIDNPTTLGSGLAGIKEIFAEVTNEILGEQIAVLNTDINMSTMMNDGLWLHSLGLSSNKDISLNDLGITARSTYQQYINTIVILLGLSIRCGSSTTLCNKSDLSAKLNNANTLKSELITAPTLYMAASRVVAMGKDVAIFEGVLQQLLGSCDNTGTHSGEFFGNFCIATWWKDKKGRSTGETIDQILNKNGMIITTPILDTINDIYTNVFLEHCVRIYHAVDMSSLYDEFWKTSSLVSKAQNVNLIKQAMSKVDNNLNNALQTTINDAIYDYVRRQLNSELHTASKFTTVRKNDYAEQLFDDVFVNWPNLNSMAREFYRIHLNIFRKVGSTRDFGSDETGWDNIGDKVEDNNYIRSLNKDEIRINLMKIHAGSGEIQFGNNLPFLPLTSVNGLPFITGLWYTDAANIVRKFGGALTLTFLRDLYKCVYMGDLCPLNNLPRDYDRVKSNTQDFDTNDIMTIKNFVKSRQTQATRPHMPASGSLSFNDLFVEDMITRTIYSRDEKDLYRLDANGQKIYYTNDNIRLENCAGTYLNGDQSTCPRFVRDCLLSGDKNALSACLAQLQNQNLFNVATHELANIDPKIAIEILKTFGVHKIVKQDPINGAVSSAQSFESWKENVLVNLKSDVKNAIMNNYKLCEYLKGVINFVNANPAILNYNLKNSGVTTTANLTIDDPYVNALKKTLWMNPIPNSRDGKLYESEMLVKGFAPQFAMTSPGFLTTPFQNVTYAPGTLVTPFGMMSGGANSYEESLFKKINENKRGSDLTYNLMNGVIADLERAGIKLNATDKNKIKNGSDELQKIEDRLFSLYAMLRTLTDLATYFKASGCVMDNNIREISIDQIRSRSDTMAYLSKNINDVQNCIGNNMTQQNSKCGEMVKYYSALVDTTNGKQNSDIIEITNM